METFKCSTDVEQLKNHPFHATVESLVLPVIAEYPKYAPEEDGHLVLIELHNVDRVLDDQNRPYRLSSACFSTLHREYLNKLLG